MKVYIAGASAELERAEKVIAEVRAAGFEITEDWPAKVRAAGKANEGLTLEQAQEAANSCKAGVRAADVVALLLPRPPASTQGMWWEAGIADARGIPIVAVGPPELAARCVFLSLVERVATDADVVVALNRERRAIEQRAPSWAGTLTVAQRHLLKDLAKGPVRTPRGRRVGSWRRTAVALIERGLASWGTFGSGAWPQLEITQAGRDRIDRRPVTCIYSDCRRGGEQASSPEAASCDVCFARWEQSRG